MATDGTIHFTGTISSAACTINSIANASSTQGTVDFGQVSNTTLAGAIGKKTVATQFSIELTDCAVTSAPTVSFNGADVNVSGVGSVFSSNLDGVGIMISDAANNTVYAPGVAAANTGFNALTTPDTTNAIGKFNAQLISSKATVTDGNIDTDVTFIINYSEQ